MFQRVWGLQWDGCIGTLSGFSCPTRYATVDRVEFQNADMGFQITAAGLVIDYWNAPVNIAVWISIMIVVIVGLNALPVKFYGETEFW
jgi:amino acid permease